MSTTTAGPPSDPLQDLPSIAGKVLAVVSLLSLTYIINNLVERAHLPVPEAIITVVIGVIAGAIVVYSPDSFGNNQILRFEDEAALQFMLVFIAPIIFAEGYGMKSKMFFDNLTRILVHAFLGTVISTVVVGGMIYHLVPLSMSMAECLAFGALISATDPVTTLAIFKQQGLIEKGIGHLYFSVLGESILNDAVGITLFDGFSDFVKDNEEITADKIGAMALKFCVTFGGSMLLGIVSGIVTALVLKLARMGAADEEEDHAHFNLAEVLLMLGMSYIPFLIATATQPLSGIVAVLFTGITSRHYAHYNLSAQTRDTFLPIVELLAINCETYTFLLVGMGFFVQKDVFSWSLIGVTILACLLGRALQVYPIAFAMNYMSKAKRFTFKEMHISWLAGLRGAIAFMCALGFPQNAGHQHRKYVISTTMFIVFSSMITLGWPTAWFLKVLKIGVLSPVEDISLQEKEAASNPVQEPLRIESADGTSRWARTLGGSRVGFLDKGVMQLVMTKRAIEERSEARNKAHQFHKEVEESVQNGGSLAPGSRRPSFQRSSSQSPSFIPGQPPSYTPGQPPSFIPGQPTSYTPGQPPSYIHGQAHTYTPGQAPPSYIPGQAHSYTPGQPPSAMPGLGPSFTPGERVKRRGSFARVSRVNP